MIHQTYGQRVFRFFLILFFSNWVLSMVGQNAHSYFHNLSESNGLLGNVSAFMYKDSRGFMWFSSNNLGLNRFDGLHFKYYTHSKEDSNSLRGNNILSPFFEDKYGDIWFCTRYGIHVYRRLSDNFESFPLYDDKGTVLENNYLIIHLDTEGYLWVRADGEAQVGAYLYRWQTRPKQGVNQNRQQKIRSFRGLFAAVDTFPNGKVSHVLSYFWGGDAGFIDYAFDENGKPLSETKHFNATTGTEIQTQVYKILNDTERQGYWLATEQGLIFWDKTKKTWWRKEAYDGQSIGLIMDLVLWGKNLIVGSKNAGVFFFDRLQSQFFQYIPLNTTGTEGGLKLPKVDNLYLDNDENLWVSSWSDGLNYGNLRKNKFGAIDHPSENVFLEAASMTGTGTGKLWVAKHTSGIFVVDKQQHKLVGAVEAAKGSRFFRLYTDKQNRIWGLTKNTVALFNETKQTCEWIPVKNFPSDSLTLYDIRQTHLGDILIASSKGILRLNERTKPHFFEPFKALPTASFSYIFEDNQRHLFLLHETDTLFVFQWDKERYRPIQVLSFGAEINCHIVEQDSIWLGTNKGLKHIQCSGGHLSVRSFVEGSIVQSALRDRRGLFWLGGQEGFFQFNFTSGRSKPFSKTDGLQGSIYNTSFYHDTETGTFWFGSNRRIYYFNPENIQPLTIQPKVQITRIEVNDKPYALDTAITEKWFLVLPKDSNTVTLVFSALDFSDTRMDSVRYMVEGYDETWRTVVNDGLPLRLFRLPKGVYKFRAFAINPDGVESPFEKIFYIRILPAWYETGWFYTAAFLLVVWGIWQFIRIRERRIREIAAIKQKQTEMDLRVLRAQMNPHFIFNALNSVNNYVLKNSPTMASAFLIKFSKLMRHILNFSAKETISLEQEEMILRGYLEIEKYRFDFNFSIDIDDKLDTFETQIPTMLIQPFVENAVKHGVSSRPPGAGMIRIAFIQDADNYLRCTVEDNGIGIEINRQIKANAGQKNHESKALSITHDRLELIAEQRGREATQTIEQISPEGGTLVTIRLPL